MSIRYSINITQEYSWSQICDDHWT